MRVPASTVAEFYWQLANSIHRDIPVNDSGEPDEFTRYVGYFLDEHEAFQGPWRESLHEMALTTYLDAIAHRREPRRQLRLAAKRACVLAGQKKPLPVNWRCVPTEAYVVVNAVLIAIVVASAVAQMTGPLAVITAVGVCLGAWFVADVLSYMIHVNSDGWGDDMGSRVFQDHHFFEDEAARWTWLRAIDTTAPKVLPVMGLLALNRPHFTVAFAVLVILQGLLITPKTHGMAHRVDKRGWFGTLQRLKLLLPPEEHTRHHRDRDQAFAGLNGWSNRMLDATRYADWHASVRIWMGSTPPKPRQHLLDGRDQRPIASRTV